LHEADNRIPVFKHFRSAQDIRDLKGRRNATREARRWQGAVLPESGRTDDGGVDRDRW
jgi:hypothetical protein